MPLFGKLFSKRISPRSGQVQKPILKRPIAKPAPKPAPKPGLFGQKKYRSFLELRDFARKAPYKAIPKTSRKLTRKQRVELMRTLQKYSGQSFGLSDSKFNSALQRMKKEKMAAGYKRDYKKIVDLDLKIKQLEAWKKG